MKNKKNIIINEYSDAITGKKTGIVYATGKAKFAGYSEKQLEELPESISENSFGCGNPLAFSEVKDGQTVLDLGCGAGLDLLLAADKVGDTGSVIGVDMNQDMLDKAQENITAYGKTNIELKKGTIENLPITSHSIDWVISNCVINLSSQKEVAFAEIARVLKPNGRMLVSDIVSNKLPWWLKRSGLLNAACAGGVISEKEYLIGLNKAGLSEVKIVSRQYYEASQLASIVVDSLPSFIRNLSCCGQSIAMKIITKIAQPVSKKLWSAKISGMVI